MCFSLEASLGAGILLGAAGIAIQARYKPPLHQQGLAFLPLIFALHQLLEAGVWATVDSSSASGLNTFFTYAYVFVAFTFWPIYVPLAVQAFNRGIYRRTLVGLALLGFAVGCYLFYSYAIYHPASSSVGCGRTGCHSIVYDVQDPLFNDAIKYPYLVAATLPFFFCVNQRVRWLLGPLFVVSFPIGMLLAHDKSFPSLWCFVAALVSAAAYTVFSSKKT